MLKFLRSSFLLLTILMVTGCAGKLANQTYEDQIIPDPYENINRSFFAFNVGLDLVISRPVSTAYDRVTPSFVRTGVSNFLSNLTEPRNAINNFLQLKIDRGFTSIMRFAFNSTIGLGGLVDIMSGSGVPQVPEDFGQTLAYWGAKPGAYIYLPILGPSSVRDSIGRIGDFLMLSPNQIINDSTNETYHTVLNVVESRADLLPLDPILKRQVNIYNFLHNGYEQTRIDKVFDGNPPEIKEDF